jgi:O-antigen ligase
VFGGLFALRSESGRAWLLENRNLPSFLDRLAFRGFGDDRWVLWDLAVKSIIERPMFGWGTEQFAQVADKYLDLTTAREVFAENKITRAHNQYLDVTLSYGLVGFAAYLFLLMALIRALIKLLQFARSSEEYRSVIILSSFFLSYLGYSFLRSIPRNS